MPRILLALAGLLIVAASLCEAQSSGANTGLNPGQITVNLKKKFWSREQMSQGSRMRVHIEWQITFADFVAESGFTYILFGHEYVVYGIANKAIRNPFDDATPTSWWRTTEFILAATEQVPPTIQARLWFVSKDKKRWRSKPFSINLSAYQGPIGPVPKIGLPSLPSGGSNAKPKQ